MFSMLPLLVGLSLTAQAGKVTVPVDIGLGPAGHMITGLSLIHISEPTRPY